MLYALKQHAADDPIFQCDDVTCSQDVLNDAPGLFVIADEKIRTTFPFKDVQPCWLRLYTDCSLVLSVKIVETHARSSKKATSEKIRREREAEPDIDTIWLDEVVHKLDMALIMAGGLRREDLIHSFLEQLQTLSQSPPNGASTLDAPPAGKKRRLNFTDVQGYLDVPVEDILPLNEVALPQLHYPIPRSSSMSLEAFEKHMNDIKNPIILTDSMSHWPALTSRPWRSKSYLLSRTFGGRRLVPVEIGRSYTDEEWSQAIVPFRSFLEKYILPRHRDDAANAASDVTPSSSDANPPLAPGTGYLAQHALLTQIPSLRSDIAVPDYCYVDPPPPSPGTPLHSKMIGSEYTLPRPESPVLNAWIGPPWTISPLHHDHYHNLLTQVYGSKYIRLYPPSASAHLYPRSSKELQLDGREIDMSNTSDVDVAEMELSPDEDWDERWPGISELNYVEGVLREGEMIYVPVGWWHYVRGLSTSVSVSFWWN